MSEYKRHPLSTVFGDIPPEQFRQLAADIKSHGLQHPVLLWHEQVLDGWHRYRACLDVGIEPKFETFEGDEAAALQRVTSENFHRRHLNEAQRISLVKQLTRWHVERARSGDNQHTTEGENAASPSKSTIAKTANVSARTVQLHNTVEQASPKLIKATESGQIGLRAAAKIAREVPGDVIEKCEIVDLMKTIAELPETRLKNLEGLAGRLAAEAEALAPAVGSVDEARLRMVLHDLERAVRALAGDGGECG